MRAYYAVELNRMLAAIYWSETHCPAPLSDGEALGYARAILWAAIEKDADPEEFIRAVLQPSGCDN